MLINFYGLLLYDPVAFLLLSVLIVVAILIAISVHEFSHALAANILGDGTAKSLGRLTLNPCKHIDPTGICMLLVAGFGWGKPVPVDSRNLVVGRVGIFLVAVAGPLSNIVLAFLLAIPIKLGLLAWHDPALLNPMLLLSGGVMSSIGDVASMVIFFNLLLALFNLIPLIPLDGAKMVEGLVPGNYLQGYQRVVRFGPILLISMVLIDITFHAGLLWGIIGAPLALLIKIAVEI
jgi:Zn-dependent protease